MNFPTKKIVKNLQGIALTRARQKVNKYPRIIREMEKTPKYNLDIGEISRVYFGVYSLTITTYWHAVVPAK